MRNDSLPPLGILLDDREDGKALLKLGDPTAFIRERLAKASLKAEKETQKREGAVERARLKLNRLTRGSVSERELFKTKDYSQWDDQVRDFGLI